MPFRESRMKHILKEVKEAGMYDFILIDCHPAFNLLNQSILYASDYVIVPLMPGTFAMRGMEHIVAFLSNIQATSPDNHPVEILGVLLNNYNRSRKLDKFVIEKTHEIFGNHVPIFESIIPTDAGIDQAQMICKPIGSDKEVNRFRSNKAYICLAQEVLRNVSQS